MSETLNLSDPRSGNERRIAPWGDGKGEWLRWFIALVFASIVGYFAASQQIEQRLSALESKVDARDAEIVRFMQRIDSTLMSIQQRQAEHRD